MGDRGIQTEPIFLFFSSYHQCVHNLVLTHHFIFFSSFHTKMMPTFSLNYHDKLSIILVFILFVVSWKAILLFFFEFHLHPIVLFKIGVVQVIFILATLLVIKLVQIGIKKAYEKLNTEIKRQCIINLLVGLGLSCLASMVPRILMYQIQYKRESHGVSQNCQN